MSPRRTDPKSKAPSGGLPNWVIIVGVVVVVVLAAVGLFMLQTPSAPAPVALSTSSAVTSGRTMGNPNAKVDLVEYSDFQ